MTDAKTAAAEIGNRARMALAGFGAASLKSKLFECVEIVAREAAERGLADHDAALAEAVREQCAQEAEKYDRELVEDWEGVKTRPPLSERIRALPLPDADASQPSASRRRSGYTPLIVPPGGTLSQAIENAKPKHDERIQLEARLEECDYWYESVLRGYYGDQHRQRRAELKAALARLEQGRSDAK